MRDAILQYLAEQGDASFEAMERDIPGFAGDFALYLEHEGETLVLWPQLSQPASDAIRALIRERLISVEPVGPVIGCFEPVPVKVLDGPFAGAKRLPVVLRFGSATG